MKQTSRWYSQRLHREVTTVRWGTYGTPVLLFPTAGGDAEEVERFWMMKVLAPLIDAGKVKVYSVDSVAGRAMIEQEGTQHHRQWLLNQFHQFLKHEVVPAIRQDCNQKDIEIISAGASIGAFHAVAMVCRFPDIFKSALAMSGTFDLRRFYKADHFGQEFYVSSPVHFVHSLGGPHLEQLRKRFILIASGEGRAEDISESWNLARVLGKKGVPNRVDSWGKETPHDWMTWRDMMPRYLPELLGRP